MGLEQFFKPKSIVIIGASGKAGSLGYTLTENVMMTFRGKTYLVNIKGGEILGTKVYRDVSLLPETPDLALIIIPAKHVPGVVEKLGEMGVKAVVILSGGFSEVGNRELEEEVVRIARRYGMRIVGPNCVGVMNFHLPLDATFTSREHQGRPRPGPISLVTQSGALGSMILDISAEIGIGYSKYISVGNMADVSVNESIRYLSSDPETDVIALYVEGVKDGREFMDACRKARMNGKKVVVLKAGTTSSGSRAAASHTGSLAGSYEIFRAAVKQGGGVVVETLEEFLGLLQILGKRPLDPGLGRTMILTNAGGMGVVTADMLDKHGIPVPPTPPQIERILREKLPPYCTLSNPIDLSGDAQAKRYDEALRVLRDSKDIDIIVVVSLLQSPAIDGGEFVKVVLRHYFEEKEKLILALVSGAKYSRKWIKTLAEAGVPTYTSPTTLAASLSKYIKTYAKKVDIRGNRVGGTD